MFCRECGTENLDDAKICKSCGQQLNASKNEESENTTSITAKTSGKAIASLILGILWLGGIGSLLAIILGHMARKEIKNSNGKLTGDGVAIAGLVLGYVVFGLFVIAYFGTLAAVAIPKIAQ